MLNLQEIEAAIIELENGPTNYDTCAKLASLYTIRRNINGNEVIREYKDILPEYHKYVDIKRKYQRHELTENAVIISMQNLCTEIKEFIHILYSSTDMEEERSQIRAMLTILVNSL